MTKLNKFSKRSIHVALLSMLLIMLFTGVVIATTIPEGTTTTLDKTTYDVAIGNTLTIISTTTFPDMTSVEASIYEDGQITLSQGFNSNVTLQAYYGAGKVTDIGTYTLPAGDTSFWISNFSGVTTRSALNLQTLNKTDIFTIEMAVPNDAAGKPILTTVRAVYGTTSDFDAGTTYDLASAIATVNVAPETVTSITVATPTKDGTGTGATNIGNYAVGIVAGTSPNFATAITGTQALVDVESANATQGTAKWAGVLITTDKDVTSLAVKTPGMSTFANLTPTDIDEAVAAGATGTKTFVWWLKSEDISTGKDISIKVQGQDDSTAVKLNVTFNGYTVVKETPVANAVAATAVNVGQALSNSTLTGTFKNAFDTVVDGTLVWDVPATVVNATGDFAWTFTPADTATYNMVTGIVSVTANPVAQTGAPAFIAGTPATFGTELTVGVGNLGTQTNLTYTWYRSADASYDAGTDISIGIGITYTPIETDIANYLIVVATSTDATGNGTVATVTVVAKATGPAAPIAPDLATKTDTSITLVADALNQFSKDDGTTWQDSEAFTGLTAETAYTFVARVKATATTNESVASAGTTITTDATALPVMGGTVAITGTEKFGQILTADISGITYTPVISTDVPTYQWKRGGVDIDGAIASTYTLVEADIAATITVTVTADGTNATGNVTSAATGAIAKADGLALAGVTIDDTANTVTGMTAAMEFSTNGTDWTVYDAVTPNLPDLTGTVALQIRIASTVTHETGAATIFNFTVPVTVTGITVKTAPTKVTYTEGENLDLTGLIITLTKSDASTLDVAFADFATNGITTVKANGDAVATTDTEVVITVNGKTASQAIAVNATPLSTETDITAFSFTEQTGFATIDTTNHIVIIEVAYGTDVSSLSPTTMTLSTGATIAPVGPQNFATPVTYTVTAEDGTTQSWTVTVTVAAPPASNTATVTSGSYTVSTSGIPTETITNIPFGTTKVHFLAALTKGEANQTWDISGISDPVKSNDKLIVTAQDRITTVTYTITVNLAPADLTAYNAALVAVVQTDYTTASWTTYQAVIDANVVTDQNTQTEVDTATTNITAAQANLVCAGQASLDTAKSDAAALTEGDYTVASWTVLTNAFALPETTNAEVVAKTTAINDAISLLEKVPTSISVTNITVTGTGNATTLINGSTLQMSAAVSPIDATDPSVTWSVTNGTGTATIDVNGLLTVTGEGTVTVTATANDGSGITGTLNITITPTPVTLSSIAITSPANKLNYIVGDSLDITGLEVTGTYSDNSTAVLPITTTDITGFDSSVPATAQTLTITIGGKTTTYTITITNKFTIITTFNKSSLVADQTLDATVEATNNQVVSQQVMLIVALYNQSGDMVSVSYISKDVAANDIENLHAGFKLPLNVTGYTAKAFVWEGIDITASSLIPISNVEQI